MGQRVALPRLLTEAVLHLATKAVQLFAQGRQQAVQALAVLFIDAAVTLLKDAVGEVFELLAQALFAVDHLADFVFRMQLGGLQPGSDFAQVSFQRGVDIPQIAQLVVEQLAFVAPVPALGYVLS
ncbi:hypothetical protein D3C76_1232120 [compost metagenome]